MDSTMVHEPNGRGSIPTFTNTDRSKWMNRIGRVAFGLVVGFFLLAGPSVANATPEETTTTEAPKIHKAFVCKYVGTPHVDERLQTGQNPISVDFHSIPVDPVVVGAEFTDAQGRSVVIAIDVGQPEPSVSSCPSAIGPPPTTTIGLPPPPPPPVTTVPGVPTTPAGPVPTTENSQPTTTGGQQPPPPPGTDPRTVPTPPTSVGTGTTTVAQTSVPGASDTPCVGCEPPPISVPGTRTVQTTTTQPQGSLPATGGDPRTILLVAGISGLVGCSTLLVRGWRRHTA